MYVTARTALQWGMVKTTPSGHEVETFDTYTQQSHSRRASRVKVSLVQQVAEDIVACFVHLRAM